MRGVNKVILIGNLGGDPELRHTDSGTPVANFSLATNWKTANGEGVEWHRIVAWDKAAEILDEYVSKGDPLYVEGRLQTRSYKVDGEEKPRFMTEVVVERFNFLGSSNGNSGSDSGGYRDRPSAPETVEPEDADWDDFDDDLPF